ncbi:hypothetical protein [uncultured Clostridium sp.]|uniref:hypothetical protein n=1 Tax=uncultured Clostridium sp. TaxID=59620 RepID=UPI00258355DA|nr:hypothetical protein [uncultured Clostridium sp.]
MEKFYMLIGGEFSNTKKIRIKNMEFERYCKDEGVNSLQIKRDIYNLNYNKRKNFLNFILSLVRN